MVYDFVKRRVFFFYNHFAKLNSGFEPIGIISRRPFLFISSYYPARQKPFEFLNKLATALRKFDVTWIFICTWYISPQDAQHCKRSIDKFKQRFGRHDFIILANSLDELLNLKEAGIRTIFCNHNCFIDERVFYPISGVKELDAVYDARLSPFKRHWLAKEIGSLGLITYGGDGNSQERRDYVSQTKLDFAYAHWLNRYETNNYRFLSPAEVNTQLNRAKIGLCLSKKEGAMFASIQYLLAGLPIVTTFNTGGRDEFFNPDYTLWVKDSPIEVRNACSKLISSNIDPWSIHKSTLQKMECHRSRFIGLVQGILKRSGKDIDYSREFQLSFFNKMQNSRLTWLDLLR